MPNELWLYTDPANAQVELTADNGVKAVGIPQFHANREDAQLLEIPFDTGGIGCQLVIGANGFQTFVGRAVLMSGEGIAYLSMDDFHLNPTPVAPPIPPPDSGGEYTGSASEIVQQVYEKTNADLSTKEGCGKFTEDVCTALHDNDNPWWGHIKKTGAQNQYNGHAVDAIMLATGDGAGGYDIIQNSVSPEAAPVLNWIGPPDLNLWYYPAAGQKSAR